MSNVAINIAAEFTGKNAFKKAETSVDRLNKTTKGLSKTFARTFGTAAVLAFGKASVKAFAEDDKAATSLGITLKNLDLAYGSNIGTVNGFINRLEAQTGVLDDELRPAMDRLLRATGSVTKAQELLGLALDVAAGTGKSVTQVSQSLQKAYLGQTQALGRLGVGLSKAELTSSSFEEIQLRLTALFAGQASAAADTFAGQLDKLTIAANNAKETIGKGLYDGISALSGGGATAATDNINKLATGIGDTLANVGSLINKLKALKPVLIGIGIAAAAAFLPMTTAIVGAIFLLGQLNKALDKSLFKQGIIPNGMGNISMTKSSQDTQKADAVAKKNQAAMTKLTKEQAVAQAKIVKDKKLGAAIDKANLVLLKGEETFDLDKIQIAAALTNQAELLGKSTSSAQLLQIANDTARLNVKKSILALEDAIAAKDEAAIIAATAKLNADLKILNALTGQNVKLADIKSILDTLKPVDLVNQSNLDKALATIQEMLRLLAQANTQAKTKIPTSGSLGSGIPAGDYIAPISTKGGSIEAILEYADAATARANAFADLLDMDTAAKTAALQTSSLAQAGAYNPNALQSFRQSEAAAMNITVNTGIGDPEAIARAVEDVIRQSYQRGTSSTGLLAV